LPRAMVMPPSQEALPLPKMRFRSRWMAWFWLLPPMREMAWPPAPVIVSPRRVTNLDCCRRMAWPCVHWVVGGVRSTLPGGRAGSASITIRSASVAVGRLFLPWIVTCSG
jgi:hypothetical protein